MADQNRASRMDRVERMMELLITDHAKFSDEHKQLLTAQVVLTDRMGRLTTTTQELAEAQKYTNQQMKETDERLGILIRTMDGFLRGRDKTGIALTKPVKNLTILAVKLAVASRQRPRRSPLIPRKND
jgi:hypothetical protein